MAEKTINYIGSIFTKTGAAKMANSVLTKVPVEPAYIVIGDGGGNGYTPVPEQNSLVNEVYRATIAREDRASNDPAHLILWGHVPADVGSFVIREIGVEDKDGDLIAVGSVPDITKMKPEDFGAALDLTIKFHLIVTTESTFKVVIDPTTVIASMEDVLELEARIQEQIDGIPIYLPITNEMIDSLDDMPVGTIEVNGLDISIEDIRKFLDDDPDNDPIYDENPVLKSIEISKAEVLNILNAKEE